MNGRNTRTDQNEIQHRYLDYIRIRLDVKNFFQILADQAMLLAKDLF